MTKEKTIQEIKKIITKYDAFNIGELDNFDSAPSVGCIGSVAGLVEYFDKDYAEINVYHTNSFSSDAIESYTEVYENLNIDVLQEILILCEEFEAQTLKTLKRISNE